jgi:hypothetical protein
MMQQPALRTNSNAFVTPVSRRSDPTVAMEMLKKDPAFQKRFREENEALPLPDPADDSDTLMSPSKRLQPRNLDFDRVASSDDLFGRASKSPKTASEGDALAEIAALKDDDQEETAPMSQDPPQLEELEEGELSSQSLGFARCMSEALWP